LGELEAVGDDLEVIGVGILLISFAAVALLGHTLKDDPLVASVTPA